MFWLACLCTISIFGVLFWENTMWTWVVSGRGSKSEIFHRHCTFDCDYSVYFYGWIATFSKSTVCSGWPVCVPISIFGVLFEEKRSELEVCHVMIMQVRWPRIEKWNFSSSLYIRLWLFCLFLWMNCYKFIINSMFWLALLCTNFNIWCTFSRKSDVNLRYVCPCLSCHIKTSLLTGTAYIYAMHTMYTTEPGHTENIYLISPEIVWKTQWHTGPSSWHRMYTGDSGRGRPRRVCLFGKCS